MIAELVDAELPPPEERYPLRVLKTIGRVLYEEVR